MKTGDSTNDKVDGTGAVPLDDVFSTDIDDLRSNLPDRWGELITSYRQLQVL